MIIEEGKSNSSRFITAYNTIDQTLRAIYNFKRNMTFSDMIRRSVSLNSVIRRFEDKLIDYARLRNAIIHNSNEEYVIAEPHDDVVAEMERIAQMVSCPPLVIDTVAKNVLTIKGEMSLKDVFIMFASTGFKNIPVYGNGEILGIASPARLVEWVGTELKNNKDIDTFLEKTEVSQILYKTDAEVRYCVRSDRLTIQEALDIFYSNRKINSILITRSGGTKEPIRGIITVADIMDLNKIIDDYD